MKTRLISQLLLIHSSCAFLPLVQAQPAGETSGSYATPPGYTRREFLATNVIRIPRETPAETLRWLEARRDQQVKGAAQVEAFHGFSFSDRIRESGLTFRHGVVDDAGKDWVPGHYDHGTGLAVADVDGDGQLDIYFVNQQGGSELWRNLGKGAFENITAKAGVGLKDRVGVAASFGDFDNDGKPDLFVTTVRMGNVLFHNLGGGRFADVTASAGLGYIGHSSGAVVFDFNKDGLLDLFLCNVGVYTTDQKGPSGFYRTVTNAFRGQNYPNRSEQSILYQNLGSLKFRNVSKETHLEHRGWSGDASFCDLGQTGFPSLYVLSMSGSDVYYQNIQGRTFQNETVRQFGKTPWGSMGIKFFDFNQDGLIDLYVTDMHSDMTDLQTQVGRTNKNRLWEAGKSDPWCTAELTVAILGTAQTNFIFGNAFYQKAGSGFFREISDSIGAETYWPWGISVADLNADGFEDVFVTAGMGHPFRYGINSLLLNQGGKRFEDAEFLLGIEPRIGNKTEIDAFVLDCAGKDKNHPYSYHRQDKLTVKSPASSRSSAAFDLDNDGDLDIIVNNLNDEPAVLISNLAEKRPIHFLKVQLKGTVSNSDGLGALVKVRAGGKTYTQFHDGKSGYLSQSLMPLYFGLGDADKVDQIEVVWPSGTKQMASVAEINRTVRIVEQGQ